MVSSIPSWPAGSARTRINLAALLIALVAGILVAKYWEQSQVARMRRDSRSLHDDRLVPELLLFHMVDELHARRDTLRSHLGPAATPSLEDLGYVLDQHGARLQELVGRFTHTYLVEQEAQYLAALETALREYDASERGLVERLEAGEDVRYGAEIQDRFDAARQELLHLSDVQRSVGAELAAESAASADHITTLLHFQLGAALVLGVVASALALGVNRPGHRRDEVNAHLN